MCFHFCVLPCFPWLLPNWTLAKNRPRIYPTSSPKARRVAGRGSNRHRHVKTCCGHVPRHRQSRHKGSHSLDFGRLDLRYEGKPLALNSDGCSGLIGQLFRATTLGSRLRVRRPRLTGQNVPIFNCFSSLFARVQALTNADGLSGPPFGVHYTTLQGWVRAVDLREHELEGHSQRVTEMTVRLARALRSTALLVTRRFIIPL